MKKLQVLGAGCPKCNKLMALTDQAAKELGIEYQLEKVTDLNKIMEFGVMMVPALVKDGEVLFAGKVPKVAELKTLLV